MKKEYDFSKAIQGKFHRPGSKVKLPNAAQEWAANNPAYYWKVGTKVTWVDPVSGVAHKATIKSKGRYAHIGRSVEIILSDGVVRRVPPFTLVRRGK